MKMSKLSNQTNSQDPQAVNSRIFVGNLNTFQCSKTDVERMFQKYGRLAGISMHKGYAFVQFTNPFDARTACHGEDGRNILSQILDVNMVAEPKPHQIGRKRQNLTKTGNDWDYYYDSYYASTLFPTTTPRPIKRQRLMTPQSRGNIVVNAKVNSPQHLPHQQQIILTSSPIANGNNGYIGIHNGNCNGSELHQQQLLIQTSNPPLYANSNHHLQQQQQLLGPFKIYSNQDTLICGNCKECFTELAELLDHKRSYCKLRFTCKCQDNILSSPQTFSQRNILMSKLLCAVCKDVFSNPWDLMVHVQAAHMINIYEFENDNSNNNNIKVNNSTSNNNNGSIYAEELPIQKHNGTILNDDNDLDMNVSSPRSSVSGKEENDRGLNIDRNSFNLSSPNHNLQSDDNKDNYSVSSSRDSSPRLESASPLQTCITSNIIDASPSTATRDTVGIVGSALSITVPNATIAASQ